MSTKSRKQKRRTHPRYASIIRMGSALSSASKAEHRKKPARSSRHSDVRVIVQNGVDVSDLGITIEAPEMPSHTHFPKKRGTKSNRRLNASVIGSI